jgi:hypothetical protein
MPHFHLHRPSNDLIPWSQAGYVIMVGLAVVVIAVRSDMNPRLRQFLRSVPVIGEFVRSGDTPTSPAGDRPAAQHDGSRALIFLPSDPKLHRSV